MKISINHCSALSLMLIFCSINLIAQNDLTGMVDTIRLDPNIRSGNLPSGLTYYLRNVNSPDQPFEMRLVIKAGLFQEEADQLELSHLLEHLAFRKLEHFPRGLSDFSSRHGLTFGKNVTGHTGGFSTVYGLSFPSQLLDSGITILKDWSSGISLDSVEIEQEKKVVLAERNRGSSINANNNNYSTILFKDLDYIQDDYEERNRNLMTFKHEALMRYYKKWYCPKNQAIIIIGNMNIDSVENKIIETFRPIISSVNCIESGININVILSGQKYFIRMQIDAKRPTEVLLNFRHNATIPLTTQDFKKKEAIKIYNYMMELRLDELIKDGKLNYHFMGRNNINSEMNLDMLTTSFYIRNPDSVESSFKNIYKELVRVRKHGFSSEEFEFAKKELLKAKEELKGNHSTSESFANRLVEHFLRGYAVPDPEFEYQITKKGIDQITLNDINIMTKEWISDFNRDIVIKAANEYKNLPDETDFIKWMEEINRMKIPPYRKKVVIQEKIIFSEEDKLKFKQNKNYVTRSLKKMNIVELTLPNGVKVVLNPFTPEDGMYNDKILVRAVSPGGLSLYYDDDYPSAKYACDIIASSGIGSLNYAALFRFMDQNQINGGPVIKDRFAGFDFSCPPTKEGVESIMQLVYLYFHYPTKNEIAFNDWLSKLKKRTKEKENDPMEVFSEIKSKMMFTNNFRKNPLSLNNINKINLDKTFQLFRERFSDASNFTFIITGDYRIDDIKPIVLKYLGSLPALHKKEKAQENSTRLVSRNIKEKIIGGNQKSAYINLHYTGHYIPNKKNDLKLELVDKVMRTVLLDRLRSKEGGTYTVPVSVTKFDRQYIFNISFQCDTSSVDNMISATYDELRLLKNKGIDESIFNKAISIQRNSIKSNLQNNDYMSAYLLTKYLNRSDPMGILKQLNMLNTLTRKALQRATKKYLNNDSTQQFILMPEKV